MFNYQNKINTIQELNDMLDDLNKTTDDIAWIGTKDGAYACSYDYFQSHFNFYYDPKINLLEVKQNGNIDYETENPTINQDLVVMFENNDYLYRTTHWSGLATIFETWEFEENPTLQKNHKLLLNIKNKRDPQK